MWLFVKTFPGHLLVTESLLYVVVPSAAIIDLSRQSLKYPVSYLAKGKMIIEASEWSNLEE